MKKKICEISGYFFILLAIGAALSMSLPDAIEKNNRIDCLKLLRQSKEISHRYFFLTPAQKEMCDELKIDINAPVRIDKN